MVSSSCKGCTLSPAGSLSQAGRHVASWATRGAPALKAADLQPFSLWALHSCLRYLVYREVPRNTCIRINQRTKRLGATMQIDLGNKLFPC